MCTTDKTGWNNSVPIFLLYQILSLKKQEYKVLLNTSVYFWPVRTVRWKRHFSLFILILIIFVITYIFQRRRKNSFGPNTYIFKMISHMKMDKKNQSDSSISKPINHAFRNIMKSKKYRKNLQNKKEKKNHFVISLKDMKRKMLRKYHFYIKNHLKPIQMPALYWFW